MRTTLVAAIVAVLATVLGGCIAVPGDTANIQLVSSSTSNGWQVDYYVNTAYPCAISGFQTFVIMHRTSQSATAPAPLWVHMHGGGTGYWNTSTNPPTFVPDTQFTSQEDVAELQSRAGTGGLSQAIADDAAGFRIVSVSYCDRDVYGGTGAADPGNPNTYTTPSGQTATRTTNGLLATKAAIRFAESRFPTTKFFLQGTSAGSAGAYAVTWGLQQQGLPPAGTVADSGIYSPLAAQALQDQHVACSGNAQAGAAPGLLARVDPTLADPNNSPDKLVARGDLTVPIAQVWDHGDPTECGTATVLCPLQYVPTGSPTQQTLAAPDCINQAMHQAIVNQGPSSRSISIEVCVSAKDPTNPAPSTCNRHVVTTINGVSSMQPSDYNGTLLTWVHARLADT